MSCAHGQTSTPETCSQCLGASVKHVTIKAGETRINGRKLTTTQPELTGRALMKAYATAAFHNSRGAQAHRKGKKIAAAKRAQIATDDNEFVIDWEDELDL